MIGAICLIFTTIMSVSGSDHCIKHTIWNLEKKVSDTELQAALILKNFSFLIADEQYRKNFKEQEDRLLNHLKEFCEQYKKAKSKKVTSLCDHIKKYLGDIEQCDRTLIIKKITTITWYLFDVSNKARDDSNDFKKMYLRLFGQLYKHEINILDIAHKKQNALKHAIAIENVPLVEALLQFNQDLKSLDAKKDHILTPEEIDSYKQLTKNTVIVEKLQKTYHYRPQFKGHYN